MLTILAAVGFLLAAVAAVLGWVSTPIDGNRLLGAMDAAGPWFIAGTVAELGAVLTR
jgi:hypothetical protein